MPWLNSFMNKLYAFWEKIRPAFAAIGRFFSKAGKVFYKIGSYLYLLRSLILAAPVAAVAFIIAMNNMERLPETLEVTKISYNPQAQDALFGFLELGVDTISRDMAVYGPLALTVACLVMMILSKRALYPFVIALLTLCLPFVLYFFQIYPA